MRWRDARPGPDQRACLKAAMDAEGGNISRAAKRLGLSRQHLYRLLQLLETPGVTPRDSVTGGDTVTRPDSVTSGDSDDGVTHGGASGTVTRSRDFPLTYGDQKPNLAAVNSTGEVTEDVVVMNLHLPRRLVQWLEMEAVRRKHAVGASKAAKSPIVAELIEKAMHESTER
jgi:hypothetical protein